MIASDTRVLYGLSLGGSIVHKESTASRRSKDASSEEKLISVTDRFGILTSEVIPVVLNVASKDQATTEYICIYSSTWEII